MSRQGLIIAGVAVSAAALLLWMIMRSADDEDGASANPPQVATGSSSDRDRPPTISRTHTEAPRLSPAEGGGTGGDGRRRDRPDRPPPTETVIDGKIVRDHRTDRSQPIQLAPRPGGVAEGSRRVSQQITGELSNRLLPIVRECGAQAPAEARSGKPRVDGSLVIAIKSHQVRVTQVGVEISNLTGPALDATKQCIQQKALAITTPAADEADLENYPIQVSFPLP